MLGEFHAQQESLQGGGGLSSPTFSQLARRSFWPLGRLQGEICFSEIIHGNFFSWPCFFCVTDSDSRGREKTRGVRQRPGSRKGKKKKRKEGKRQPEEDTKKRGKETGEHPLPAGARAPPGRFVVDVGWALQQFKPAGWGSPAVPPIEAVSECLTQLQMVCRP